MDAVLRRLPSGLALLYHTSGVGGMLGPNETPASQHTPHAIGGVRVHAHPPAASLARRPPDTLPRVTRWGGHANACFSCGRHASGGSDPLTW